MSGFGTRNDLLFIKVPLNEMRLLELVTNYPNRTVMKTARDTFSRHLWYFSEMLVCVLTSAPLLSSKKDNPTSISEKYQRCRLNVSLAVFIIVLFG